jgi:hypothetical protein
MVVEAVVVEAALVVFNLFDFGAALLFALFELERSNGGDLQHATHVYIPGCKGEALRQNTSY